MTPTNKLRWVERKEEMPPFYKSLDGGPAFRTYLVLQQWFEFRPGVRLGHNNATGEWIDVQIEKETEND